LKIGDVPGAYAHLRLAPGLEKRHARVSFVLRTPVGIRFVELIDGGLAVRHASGKQFDRCDQPN